MPKLRPLRKPEDIAAVPADKPVAIDLSEESTLVEAPEVERTEPVEAQAPPVPEQLEPEPEPEESSLKKQLEGLRRNEEELHRQIAERDARIAERELQVEQSDYDTITVSLNNAQASAERARDDYKAAVAAGDIDAQAEAHSREIDARVQANSFAAAKGDIEARRERAKTQQAQQAQPGLPASARDWLAAHPEYTRDPEKNQEIGAAHNYVTTIERKKAWSPEYFEALETHLGLRRAAPPATTTERRSHPVSAPVSRDAPSMSSGRPQRRTVELSPEQREAAKISGVDELTYAKGVLELERRKKLGMYPDRN